MIDFEPLWLTIRALVIVCCISVPLGLWKLVEIVAWAVQHIRWAP